jgi:tetratricopeptide (TPR) repeat protein
MRSPRAEQIHNRGRALAYDGQFARAAEEFRRVLKFDPGNPFARYDLALALLAQGRFDEGFSHYSARYELPGARPRPDLPFPAWTGQSLEGKSLVVFPEQGFGDQIQMARFAPVLAGLGADVTWLCEPALAPLFQGLGVRALAAAGKVEFPDPDYWCQVMDLPGLLRVSSDRIPGAPYLSATPKPLGSKVGLVRRGKPSHANEAVRSLPDDLVLPFEALNLAPESTGARSFQETAEIIAGLNLVISVDTAIAHLAGALGKPCFLLLAAQGVDWRWKRSGSTSPWYPTMRLYRQPAPGDWATVVAQVQKDMQDFL